MSFRCKSWSSGTIPTQRSRKKRAGKFQARINLGFSQSMKTGGLEQGGVTKDEYEGEQCWITHNSGA